MNRASCACHGALVPSVGPSLQPASRTVQNLLWVSKQPSNFYGAAGWCSSQPIPLRTSSQPIPLRGARETHCRIESQANYAFGTTTASF